MIPRCHPGQWAASPEGMDGPGPRRRSAEDWADELAASVSGPQVINDSKTPSGTVHVGSLRGPVILDVIARALRARGAALVVTGRREEALAALRE